MARNLLSSAILSLCGGCATSATLHAARAKEYEGPRPAYYLLLPLAVPADIVTYPFLAAYALSHGGCP